MAISATVNISGSFLDTDVSEHVTSLKKCYLSSAETLTGGKVIVVTGTTDDSAESRLTRATPDSAMRQARKSH